MAYYGLSKPRMAKLDVEKGTYSDGFAVGYAIGTNVNPQINESSMYGDNQLQEYEKAFKYADVSLETTHLPIEAASVVFGHTVTENKKIVYNTSDSANYVGYGFYANEKVKGIKKYVACILPKVLFAETDESYTTQGENLEFKSTSISGRAMPVENGDWKVKETFDTEEEALNFIETFLGITKTVTTTLSSK